MKVDWKREHIYSWPNLALPHNEGIGEYYVGLIKLTKVPDFGWKSVEPNAKGRVFIIVNWKDSKTLAPDNLAGQFWRRESKSGMAGSVLFRIDKELGIQYLLNKLEKAGSFIRNYQEKYSDGYMIVPKELDRHKWVGYTAEEAKSKYNEVKDIKKLHMPFYVYQYE